MAVRTGYIFHSPYLSPLHTVYIVLYLTPTRDTSQNRVLTHGRIVTSLDIANETYNISLFIQHCQFFSQHLTLHPTPRHGASSGDPSHVRQRGACTLFPRRITLRGQSARSPAKRPRRQECRSQVSRPLQGLEEYVSSRSSVSVDVEVSTASRCLSLASSCTPWRRNVCTKCHGVQRIARPHQSRGYCSQAGTRLWIRLTTGEERHQTKC